MGIMCILPVVSCSNTDESVNGYKTYYEVAIKNIIFDKMGDIEVSQETFDKLSDSTSLDETIYTDDKNNEFNLFGLLFGKDNEKNKTQVKEFLMKFNSKWLPDSASKDEPQLSLTKNFSILDFKEENDSKSFKIGAQVVILQKDNDGNIEDASSFSILSGKFTIKVEKPKK